MERMVRTLILQIRVTPEPTDPSQHHQRDKQSLCLQCNEDTALPMTLSLEESASTHTCNPHCTFMGNKAPKGILPKMGDLGWILTQANQMHRDCCDMREN